MSGIGRQLPPVPMRQMAALGVVLAAMRRQAALNFKRSAPVKNVPFLISYPPYTANPALDTFFGKPQILVRENPNRISLILAQVMFYTAPAVYQASYSYGYPAVAPTVEGGAARIYNIIAPGAFLSIGSPTQTQGELGNGTIAVDDVYTTLSLFTAGPAMAGSAGFILAYEGTLALESERTHPRAA